MLKSDAALSELGYHDCKDREQFVGFAQQLIERFTLNTAIITQQFQPQLRLIGFLEQAVQLRAEFRIGARSRRLPGMRSD